MQPEILERQNVYDGYLAIDRLRVRLADGTIVGREVERHGDAAAVLPYDAERRCALIWSSPGVSSERCRSLGATSMREELPTASSLR
jgi:hypothetical protein